MCGGSFRRESDKKKYECVVEQSKPVWEQRGAAQAGTRQRRFRSRGERLRIDARIQPETPQVK